MNRICLPILNVGIKDGITIADGAGQAFNGADQYAYITDNGDLDINQASTDFCISGWAKANADGNTEYIFGKNIATSISGRYGFYKETNNIVKFITESSGGSVTVTTSIDGDTDTSEHLFTARIDLVNLKIYVYVDGVLQNTGGTSYTGTLATTSNAYEFYIGAGNNSGGTTSTFGANTQIRDVRVYHKDVTSVANFAKLQNNEKIGDEIAWLNLPTLTGYGGTAYDLTGVNL